MNDIKRYLESKETKKNNFSLQYWSLRTKHRTLTKSRKITKQSHEGWSTFFWQGIQYQSPFGSLFVVIPSLSVSIVSVFWLCMMHLFLFAVFLISSLNKQDTQNFLCESSREGNWTFPENKPTFFVGFFGTFRETSAHVNNHFTRFHSILCNVLCWSLRNSQRYFNPRDNSLDSIHNELDEIVYVWILRKYIWVGCHTAPIGACCLEISETLDVWNRTWPRHWLEGLYLLQMCRVLQLSVRESEHSKSFGWFLQMERKQWQMHVCSKVGVEFKNFCISESVPWLSIQMLHLLDFGMRNQWQQPLLMRYSLAFLLLCNFGDRKRR